ncbi:VanZ family protein [Neobacillus novalis]|uniref:VanZ family protein n=1 Tax=Neobacillus novalis TaxID=220687 RepID=A0AA95SAC6_9BACI|nr:VanZ family protein [Neobacillus novalis]WHY85632.1 VanZ family protein [Neobacillus novalis]
MSYYRKIKFCLPWIFVLVWMILIFNLSAQPASHSGQLSRGVTAVVVETVKQITPVTDVTVDRWDHIVRKNAHFFIYLMLAIWVFNALLKSRIAGLKGFFLAMAICVLYAISDEFHQVFVPGRGPAAKDVLIDSAGAIVGIWIYKLAALAIKTRKRNRLSEGHRDGRKGSLPVAKRRS